MRAVSLLLLVALVSCGGAETTGTVTQTRNTPVTPGTNTVSVTNNSFGPASLTIAPGASVTWAWNSCSGGDGYGNGETCVDHSVVWDDGAPSSPLQSSGTYSRTFAAAGTYPYHCAVHGAAMSGTVVVQ